MAARKGEQTRKKILGRALALAGEVGLDGLSIGALASETRLSKSGLFAHFKSKETLQLEVLQATIDRFIAQVIQPALKAPRGEPRIRLLFQKNVAWIRGTEGRRGCLLQKLASEYADRPGAVREAVAQALKDWHQVVSRSVRLGIEAGAFRPEVDPDVFADEFLGIAMAYQQAHRLFRDPAAGRRTEAIFEALVARARRQPHSDTGAIS